MAQQSARRDRDNQCATPYLEYATLIWTRSANSHAGRRSNGRARGRTDGSIRLRATAILKFPLALKGAFSNRGLHVNGFALRTAGLTPRGHGSLRGQRVGRRTIGSGRARVVQSPQRAGPMAATEPRHGPRRTDPGPRPGERALAPGSEPSP